MTTLPNKVKNLIDRPNFAHFATLMKDGGPHVDPVWVAREGDRILIGTGESTLKARNTQRDARVALSIIDFENPYEMAHIRGRIVERRADGDLSAMDPISIKYTGREFPLRDPAGRILLVLEAEHVRYVSLPFKHTPQR